MKLSDNAKKFIEIKEYFNRLNSEMSNVVQSFYIWEYLYFSRSITRLGEEKAKNNTETMNLYKNFFIQIENSHVSYFITGIVKFFDEDSEALTLHSLMKKIREDKDSLNAKIITEVYPERFDENEIHENYLPIKLEDQRKIKQFKKEYAPLIKELRNIRHKELAHNDIELVDVKFIPEKIESFIETIQKILNLISNNFDRSVTDWSGIKNGAIKDVELLFENLKRGEEKRLKDIKEKWEDK